MNRRTNRGPAISRNGRGLHVRPVPGSSYASPRFSHKQLLVLSGCKNLDEKHVWIEWGVSAMFDVVDGK